MRISRPSRMHTSCRHLPALVALGVLAALAGCGGARGPAPGASDTGSGLVGIALAGPQCPVEIAGSPCPPKPIAARVVVHDHTGTEVISFRTRADGTFRVVLPPGRYTLLSIDPAPPLLKPTDVIVKAGQYTWIDLHLDTGIR